MLLAICIVNYITLIFQVCGILVQIMCISSSQINCLYSLFSDLDSMDSLEDRVKKFFEKCRTIPSLKQEWKDDHFKKIKEVQDFIELYIKILHVQVN